MVRYPPWYLFSHRHICAIARLAMYRTMFVRYRIKTSTKDFSDTIAASIARYESIAAGPLRTNMIGEHGENTMKLKGGSTTVHLVSALCIPLFMQTFSNRTKRGIHKRGIHEKVKFP